MATKKPMTEAQRAAKRKRDAAYRARKRAAANAAAKSVKRTAKNSETRASAPCVEGFGVATIAIPKSKVIEAVLVAFAKMLLSAFGVSQGCDCRKAKKTAPCKRSK